MAETGEVPPAGLRVVSLLPSATEIVGALGLGDRLVGVTHECDQCPDERGMEAALAAGARRVTTSAIDPQAASQREIDAAVAAHAAAATGPGASSLPPLYSVDRALVDSLRPTVILTQSLCRVCAVSGDDVAGAAGDVRSDAPSTLAEVGESIEGVGRACGVPRAGRAGREAFEARLRAVAGAVAGARARPSVVLLEWLDPVFDGGHWVPGMIRVAGCEPRLNGREGSRSERRGWAEVEAADPDVVLVACCGFDLRRNVADAGAALAAGGGDNVFAGLRAVREGRCFALDGNRYFARPAPALAAGAALVARCAHDGDAGVVAALEALPFFPAGAGAGGGAGGAAWARLAPAPGAAAGGGGAAAVAVPDIEEAFDAVHAEACRRGEPFYADPATGLMVMTRVKLEARGRCCGSGCRHCPYAHANVRDRAARIQVPATLHVPDGGVAGEVVALMWSGGKDSFLALRAMLAPGGLLRGPGPAGVVLVTTFDADTRTVAHQGVGARDVERQARHLGVALVGVPLHRHSGEGYASRLAAGLRVVEGLGSRVRAVASGDLHLPHLRAWRDEAVGRGLGVATAYPLWCDPPGGNYEALAADLRESGVPCTVSAVADARAEAAGAVVGAEFAPGLRSRLRAAGLDEFGERGEFHTLARVWEVPRERALGLGR